MESYRDECEAVQNEDQNNFTPRKPEFCLTIRLDGQDVASCIKRNDSSTYGGSRDIISPVLQDNVERSDFERDQQGLVKEKIPACHKSKGLVYPLASLFHISQNRSNPVGVECNHHSDEPSTNGHVASHLSHGIIHERNHARITTISQQNTKRTALVKGTADTDEECRTDGPADGNQLDLSVSKMALEIIGVVSYRTTLNVIAAVVGLANEFAGVLLLRSSHGCKGCCRAGNVALEQVA